MRLLFLLFFGLIILSWAQPSISVSVFDERGNLLNEKSALKIGQTIFFKIKSTQPESVENVILETWNSGVSHYEGITNNLSVENTFDIPYVIPNSSVRPNLSFDIVIRSKTGGRQHFFINKPLEWGLKENSFLESLVELNKQIKVKGISVDIEKPHITNVVSKKKSLGTLVSFDVKDSHPDLTRMRVLDRPAKCFLLKGDSYRCEIFIEETASLKSKNKIEILALDRARNSKKMNIQNIYNPTASIALAGPVKVENCLENTFDMKLSSKNHSSDIKKVDFLYFDHRQDSKRILASETLSPQKSKILSKIKKDNSLKLTLNNSSFFDVPPKYELILKDKSLREFIYTLENENPLKKSLKCEEKFLSADLIQIKESHE